MNALNRIGGILLAAGLAIAVYLGLSQNATGRRFWDGIWQAGSTVVGFVGNQAERIPALNLTGQSAFVVGLAVFGGIIAIVTIILGKNVSQRNFFYIAIAATAIAVLLYTR